MGSVLSPTAEFPVAGELVVCVYIDIADSRTAHAETDIGVSLVVQGLQLVHTHDEGTRTHLWLTACGYDILPISGKARAREDT
jgi:hypothetical protein